MLKNSPIADRADRLQRLRLQLTPQALYSAAPSAGSRVRYGVPRLTLGLRAVWRHAILLLVLIGLVV